MAKELRRMTVCIPLGLYERMEAEAERSIYRVPMSEIVRVALQAHLDKQEETGT